MKAMSEYCDIHEKIIKYVLKRDDKPMEERYEQMFTSLMKALILRPQTIFTVFMFHLSIMSFSSGNIGFVLVILYVSVFVQKMSRFHSFMIKHEKDTSD
jgi:hypothetical protein